MIAEPSGFAELKDETEFSGAGLKEASREFKLGFTHIVAFTRRHLP